jgi:hypothetical protein
VENPRRGRLVGAASQIVRYALGLDRLSLLEDGQADEALRIYKEALRLAKVV